MHLSIAIIALAIAAPVVIAEELDANDVPPACAVICRPIVSLTNMCDINPNEKYDDDHMGKRQLLDARDADDPDDRIEAECICKNKSFNVPTVMALCASCIAQNGRKTEDINEIMSQCSFSSVSYAPLSTGIVSGIQVQATKPAGGNTPAQTTSAPAATKTSGAGGVGKLANSAMAVVGVVVAVVAAGLL
ncbi:Protein CAP22 [Metarhizium brunneum]|uniref:Protein CAP22 n=1 Tax=Metarhizium brunneum TaxID=500148 RepID=A0A7D5YSA6_9HYPO